MVFVHARNDTVRTARALIDTARERNELEEFIPTEESHPGYPFAEREVYLMAAAARWLDRRGRRGRSARSTE